MGLSGFVQELGIPYTGIDGISMYDNEQLPPCHWESEWPRCSPSVLLNCWECKCPQASILYQEIMPGNLHLSQLQKKTNMQFSTEVVWTSSVITEKKSEISKNLNGTWVSRTIDRSELRRSQASILGITQEVVL